MNEFMQFEDPSKGIYELTAVLIHCGLSAYSGHYVAHILDKKVSCVTMHNILMGEGEVILLSSLR